MQSCNMQSRNLTIPKLYFNIVSKCTCPTKKFICDSCGACVCSNHIDMTYSTCNLCIYQTREFPKYDCSGLRNFSHLPCLVCDNISSNSRRIKLDNMISIIETDIKTASALFICDNCLNSEVIKRWRTRKEANIALSNFMNCHIKVLYDHNMANYNLIQEARKKILEKIKKETLTWLISDVTDIIANYCGFIRYIEYTEKRSV